MIRKALRELLRTFAWLFVASVLLFVLLDSTGEHDWWGTLQPAQAFHLSKQQALVRTVPRLYVSVVRDATVRTIDDVNQLADPTTRAAARTRLLARGAVIVPTILPRIANLSPTQKTEIFQILALMAPQLTGGDIAPTSVAPAAEWWSRFRVLHEIELRDAYARRHVQRLLDHESSNAESALMRLGTLALPALFESIELALDRHAALRLTRMISRITQLDHSVSEAMPVREVQSVIEAWRAWWFANRLEYVRLGETGRFFAHLTESRYGLWVGALLSGRLGPSKSTQGSVLHELRTRVTTSTAVAGLGGLLATALMVAFGGGRALRSRALRTKLVDFLAALVPGLAAFFVLYLILCTICKDEGSVTEWMKMSVGVTNGSFMQMMLATSLLTTAACLWLSQGKVRVVLDAVRAEAESWAKESRIPHPVQLLRHGARVGLASLLAPLALNSLLLLTLTLLVEPIFSVRGMGALTLRSVFENDGPWLLVAALTVVPILQGRRVTRSILLWSLGGRKSIFVDTSKAEVRKSTA
jgi:ABC-type dipeptide/oligopeptide/nickel transport system permease component